MQITFKNVYHAWRQCRRRKGKAPQAQQYEARLLDNLFHTVQVLQGQHWNPKPPVCFVVNNPKTREVYAAHFSDRVVHHWLVSKLEVLYEPVFIADSFSNRKGKGTHAAVDRLQHFMRSQQHYCDKTSGYYLQLDIQNYFNSIDRVILFNLLQKRLGKATKQNKFTIDEANSLRDLIHTLLKQNIVGQAYEVNPAELQAKVPPHKRLVNAGENKGIPIGNLTSQFFANVYLNELDQFIKHRLKCRHYVRYVDDFVLLHPDRQQLKQWQLDIECFLQKKLGLTLKSKKICRPISNGVDFLGYIIRPTYRLVRRRVIDHLKQRLAIFDKLLCQKCAPDLICFNLFAMQRQQLQATLASYAGHFSHANSENLGISILKHFQWLGYLMSWCQKRFIPTWEPRIVSSYRSQVRYFRRKFPYAEVVVQRGYSYDYFKPILQPSDPLLNLTALQCVKKVFVSEQGYLKQGLKRRILAEIKYLPC